VGKVSANDGDGKQIHDYLYAGDEAHANGLALENGAPLRACNVEVGTGACAYCTHRLPWRAADK
jgi:nucleoside-diphosphate-sugar epimerase